MENFSIIGTNHTSFTVSSLNTSVAFYTEVLGFSLLNRSSREASFTERVVGVPGAQIEVAYIQAPGHRLELIEYVAPKNRGKVSSRPCDTGFAHIAFDVDDIDAVVAAVRKANVEPLSDPVVVNAGPNKGGKAVYTRDPDGVTIEFIQKPN
jgi:catechol 2,3-dioxygenase-like lactoylglutathione lyase family enzyme